MVRGGLTTLKLCAVGLLLTLCGTAANAGFVADGDLTDWGLSNVPSSPSTPWVPFTGAVNPSSGVRVGPYFTYYYYLENTSDTAGHNVQLGPNYGGQDYDAEFMGVGVQGSNLNIVIVTGQRQDNGLAFFSPGDIRLQTTSGTVFGIEVGGGAGNTSQTNVSLGLNSPGTYYNLKSDGTTKTDGTGVVLDSVSHLAGTVWKNGNWQLDPINGGTPPLNGNEPVQLQFTGGTYVGSATSYIYNMSSALGAHAVIELQVPLSLFGNLEINRIQWAPACGNDFVYLDMSIVTITEVPEVPEPASFVLGVLGMAGAAGLKRRRTAA